MISSRRQVLTCAASAALLASMPQAPVRAGNAKKLTAGTKILDVNGQAAKVFALTGPDGEPGLTLGPGERFAVTLENSSGTATIIHWHGQLPDWKQDGFPWPQTPAIADGGTKSYDFAALPGTFWMHAHQGMQEQQLMAAPLIVHSAQTSRADEREAVLMLHDFSFKTPNEIFAGLTRKNGPAGGGMGGMNMMGGADLNDIGFDAYLANSRTLADPQVIRAAAGQPVRLRIINGSSSTNFWIDLGQLAGEVVAVDGHDVHPVRGQQFPLAIAQRLDILVRPPGPGAYPILAQVEGKTDRTGIILATPGAHVPAVSPQAAAAAPAVDLSLEQQLSAAQPLALRVADVVLPLRLGGNMMQYDWTLNSQIWPDVAVASLKPGQRVTLDMINESMMSHPMHLHGHAFQVTELNGMPLHGAVRDTVLVPPMGRVKIAFDAVNPGRWALHCHNLYHMMAGMMTEMRYAGIV